MNLKELKYDRMSAAEKFILSTFDGLLCYEDTLNNISLLTFKKDGLIFYRYTQNFNSLLYSYSNVCIKLRSYLDNDNEKINKIVKRMIEAQFKLKINKIDWCFFSIKI